MKFLAVLPLAALSCAAAAHPDADAVNVVLDEVKVYSYRHFDPVLDVPAAVSQLTPSTLTGGGMPSSLEGVTALAPNFYMPDYGSKLSSAIYIRGVGSRMNDPAVGMYFDNVPLLDKSMYDFDLWDIARIDLLRGPQGSLYGRNSMGGIVGIWTPSPLHNETTRFGVTYGNANTMKINAVHSQRLTDRVGISLGGNYFRTDGFFKNEFDGSDADAIESGSARIRLDWQLSQRWTGEFAVAGELSSQSGYPYGLVGASGKVAPVDYNDPSGYDRRWLLGSAHLRYMGDGVSFSSTTSWQHFDDKMTLDQDFTEANLFAMSQMQNQNAITQELIVKSEQSRRYRWLFGAFGFYKHLATQTPVTLKKDFFASVFPTLTPPMFVGAADDCDTDGIYETPSWGVAAFHQSDFRAGDFLFSAGLRFDYEMISIDHNTSAALPIEVRMPPRFTPMMYNIALQIKGDGCRHTYDDSQTFAQLSPKVTVQWAPRGDGGDRIYATVSRGYRAGGYNIQLFSDVASAKLKELGQSIMSTRADIDETLILDPETISYKPEYSWNYELGTRKRLADGRLWLDAALFYIDTRNQQVTQLVPSGLGRIMKNAARSASYGAEISVRGNLPSLSFDAAWGYTHATFRDYSDTGADLQKIDYKGCFVPFAPRNTFTAGVGKRFALRGWLEAIAAQVRYTGAGKVYFTESNDASQDFYGLLSAEVIFERKGAALSLWARNITDEQYKTFFFHGLGGNDFAQKGNPRQIGATLSIKLR